MIQPETYSHFEAFTSLLSTKRSVVLSTHINPDGDGLGSQLALADFLTSRGHTATILNHQAPPPSYTFLDPAGRTLLEFDASRDADLVRRADLIVVVDTNHPDRLGAMAGHVRASNGRKVIIDHHLEPDGFADVVIADANACATGEIVYRYLEHMKAVPPSASVATALYAAIMTDTGSFRYPKTDGDVHRIIASLVDAGADPVSIYNTIYEKGRANRLRLLGKVLSSMELHADGQVCILTITQEMFEQTATTEVDADKFVSYGLTIDGVRVSLMISELPGGVKINVRSKGRVPANEIAKAFGGNGHLNAAGARLPRTSLNDLLPKVLDVTTTHLDKD